MDDNEILTQLRKERELMMGPWCEIENVMWRHIIGLLAPIGGFAYFFMKQKEWEGIGLTREWVLFGLVQFAFVAFLFIISIFAGICTYSGYIRALETRINELSTGKTAVWVGGTWRRFTAEPHGAFFWAWLILDIVVFSAFFAMMVLFIVTTKACWMRALAIIEIVIGGGLLVWARIDLDRSERYSNELLKSEGHKEKKSGKRKRQRSRGTKVQSGED